MNFFFFLPQLNGILTDGEYAFCLHPLWQFLDSLYSESSRSEV